MHQNRIKGEHAKKYAAKFGKQLNYPIFLCERERDANVASHVIVMTIWQHDMHFEAVLGPALPKGVCLG